MFRFSRVLAFVAAVPAQIFLGNSIIQKILNDYALTHVLVAADLRIIHL
jgi:hypothetical protein